MNRNPAPVAPTGGGARARRDVHSLVRTGECFGGWTKTFTDPRLCAGTVDRLTFNRTIIETGTDAVARASIGSRTATFIRSRLPAVPLCICRKTNPG